MPTPYTHLHPCPTFQKRQLKDQSSHFNKPHLPQRPTSPTPPQLGMVGFKAMAGRRVEFVCFGFRPVVQWGLARKARNRAIHALRGNGPPTTGNAASREATKAELISTGLDVSLLLPDDSLHLFRRRPTTATSRFLHQGNAYGTWWGLCPLEGQGSPQARSSPQARVLMGWVCIVSLSSGFNAEGQYRLLFALALQRQYPFKGALCRPWNR